MVARVQQVYIMQESELMCLESERLWAESLFEEEKMRGEQRVGWMLGKNKGLAIHVEPRRPFVRKVLWRVIGIRGFY